MSILISPRRQYSRTPSSPVGKSRAKSDVPTAVLGSNSKKMIRIGTMTSPPPIPNMPLRTPADSPSTSILAISTHAIVVSLLASRQDDRGPREPGRLDAEDVVAQADRLPAPGIGQRPPRRG